VLVGVWRHFAGDIILYCVRWHCKYGISYRDLEEMMRARGIAVDHTTIYRWVQAYAPEIEKRLRWYRNGADLDGSWRVDETYITVKGNWNICIARSTRMAGPLSFICPAPARPTPPRSF